MSSFIFILRRVGIAPEETDVSYMHKEERRAAIIDAAVQLIWEKGLGAATVRGVADAVGSAPGQIHHHFKCADDLRAEAFRETWRRMNPAIIGSLNAMPPIERLVALISGFAGDQHAVGERLWRDALASARMEPGVREAVREQLGEWREVYIGALKEAKASGDAPADLNEEHSTQRLMALSLGLDVFSQVANQDDKCPNRDQLVRDAIRLELGRS